MELTTTPPAVSGRTLLARLVRADRAFARQRGDSRDRAFRAATIDRLAARMDLEDHLQATKDEVAGRKWLATLDACGGLSLVRLDAPNEGRAPKCRHTRWRSRGYWGR